MMLLILPFSMTEVELRKMMAFGSFKTIIVQLLASIKVVHLRNWKMTYIVYFV